MFRSFAARGEDPGVDLDLAGSVSSYREALSAVSAATRRADEDEELSVLDQEVEFVDCDRAGLRTPCDVVERDCAHSPWMLTRERLRAKPLE